MVGGCELWVKGAEENEEFELPKSEMTARNEIVKCGELTFQLDFNFGDNPLASLQIPEGAPGESVYSH